MSLIIELEKEVITPEELDNGEYDKTTKDGQFFSYFSRWGIPYEAYANIEVIFRQLIMLPKTNTGFRYREEQFCPEVFCKNMSAKNRATAINKFLSDLPREKRLHYGLKKLTFEKKNEVEKLKIDLKKALANVDDYYKNSEDIQIGPLLVDLKEEIKHHKQSLIKIKNKTLDASSPWKKSFLKINSSGELVVDVQKFHFLRFYIVIYFELFSPYLMGKRDKNEKLGAMGFIASKMNYEFDGRLGFKVDSDFVSRRLATAKSLNNVREAMDKSNIIDGDFYDYLDDL